LGRIPAESFGAAFSRSSWSFKCLPPSVSSVDYNSQHVYAEPEQTVTMDEDDHEDAPRSEFLDSTYHLAMLPSTEERADPMNNLDISPPGQDPGQFGLVST
jgi:hypothetical protein